MEDKISIIIPIFNLRDNISYCLKSVLNQTYRNIEVILIDDGSTDGSSEMIDALAKSDSRIKTIHQKNGGVIKARFAGIKEAAGEWIGFIDGDDYIEPDMYEHLMKNAVEYSADISHCGYQMVFPDRVDFYYNTGCLAKQDKTTGLLDLLDGSRIEPGLWNKLFHKTLFHSLLHSGVEDSGIRINEDLLMNFYLFKEAKRSVYEDFCPYHYIVRKNSAANTDTQRYHYTDPLRVRKWIREECCGNIELKQITDSLYIRCLISCLTQIEFPDISNEAKQELKQDENRLVRKELPLKLRLMTIGVLYFLPLYRVVRKIYDKITGIDHIYDISDM